MMELFSEVYGCYYEVTAAILRAAPLERRQIEALVSQRGYGESTIHLLPKLLDGGTWPLLVARDGRYESRLHTPPSLPLTLLEASWLKALLADARVRLFLSDEQLAHLADELADVEPLYRQEDFHCFDRYSDGDPYADEAYRRRFQAILAAMRERAALSIAYTPPKGRPNSGQYIPLQMEYSAKDDKFRLFAAKVRQGGLRGYYCLNLNRITALAASPERYTGPLDLDAWRRRRRCGERCVSESRTSATASSALWWSSPPLKNKASTTRTPKPASSSSGTRRTTKLKY